MNRARLEETKPARPLRRRRVEFAVDHSYRVHYIRRPFEREPDFGAASANYEFGKL